MPPACERHLLNKTTYEESNCLNLPPFNRGKSRRQYRNYLQYQEFEWRAAWDQNLGAADWFCLGGDHGSGRKPHRVERIDRRWGQYQRVWNDRGFYRY